MPYDTDIGDGDSGNIATSDEQAFRDNVLRTTRNNAVGQVKKMVDLVEDIAKTMVVNSVQGEETRIHTPMGAEMIVSKMSGEKCRGTDLDADGYPDAPLRFDFTDSEGVVQFPLNFCPGFPENNFITPVNETCPGSWGIVVREWKIFLAVSD